MGRTPAAAVQNYHFLKASDIFFMPQKEKLEKNHDNKTFKTKLLLLPKIVGKSYCSKVPKYIYKNRFVFENACYTALRQQLPTPMVLKI